MNRVVKSSVVTDVLFARLSADNISGAFYRLEAVVPANIRVVLTGQSEELGCWQPSKGIDLLCAKVPYWYVPTSVEIGEGMEYKFVLMLGGEVIAWEGGENRRWVLGSEDLGSFRSMPEFAPRMGGVSIPLFSIRSEGCEGIGDYCSLGDFALWASEMGMRVVQLLPINDTTMTHTWGDSYPYNAVSIYALHPLYIRVSEMDSKAKVKKLKALDSSSVVDYDRVDALKWELFRSIYKKRGAKTLLSSEFCEFFSANEYWLRSYAVFSYLRDKFSSSDFGGWSAPYNTYSKELEDRLLGEEYKAIAFYYFLQFHAHKQLSAARATARSCGVVFKGDIPIGVSRHSVDVWVEPQLFNLDSQAGAPPDAFAVDGQNWGFPTYNWREMAKTDYSWWKKRFHRMADYFDMYRVDHILGFFRIWEIPLPHTSGLLGHFAPALPISCEELSEWGLPMCEERYLGVDGGDINTLFVRDHTSPDMFHPRIAAHSTARYLVTMDDYERAHFDAIYTHYFYHRHNDFWAGQALNKLPAIIDSTSMLCCAEDLGMIPHCVGWVLDELQVATLEIQRMPKESGCLFADTYSYPYRSVAASSTHDMNPIRAWWEECGDATQRYYSDVMCWGGEAPSVASGEICRWIIEAHFNAPSMAAILPWQDLVSISESLRCADVGSERINEPSNPNHYWRYRMHLSVEQLRKAKGFNVELRDMISRAGR